MGKCRVAWETVCSPLKHGGLGIKRLGLWNRCLLFKHVWDILTRKNSLWVKWVHNNCIRGRNFWVIKKRNEWSWLIRNLLELRPHCRRFFISMVGNGMMTHAWEDMWDVNGHLSGVLTYRFVNGHELHNNSTVYDLRLKFGNAWPQEWINAFPQLQNVRIPTHSVEEDRIMWLGPNNAPMFFSVKMAWKSMEQVGPLLSWYKIVWHKAFIPRHAICLWMACHKRLPTQDRLCMWKNEPPDLKCMFCGVEIETHNHLFFDCNFSKSIWVTIKEEVTIHACPDNWEDIIQHWEAGAWRRWSTLHRLAISATVYHIWMERNRKFFDGHNRSVAQVVHEITKEILMRMAWKTQMKMIRGNGTG